MLTDRYVDIDGFLPELEGNSMRKIMRIRVTEVIALFEYSFGGSISLLKKEKKRKKEWWWWAKKCEPAGGFGRKRKEAIWLTSAMVGIISSIFKGPKWKSVVVFFSKK